MAARSCFVGMVATFYSILVDVASQSRWILCEHHAACIVLNGTNWATTRIGTQVVKHEEACSDKELLNFLQQKDQPLKIATFNTDRGVIKIQLHADKTPKTVANFEKTGQSRFLQRLKFHRVIADFMIQGGCPLGTGTGGPGYKFADEFHPETQTRWSRRIIDGQRRSEYEWVSILHYACGNPLAGW